MKHHLSRRRFLTQTALAGAVFYIGRSSSFGQGKSANEKLNIGIIGTHNRAAANVDGVSSQNIVAICDIDDNYLTATCAKYPEAKRYNDFRKLIDQKGIDAIVVSTTDHTHAFATSMALKSGRHVYCEKPLAHDIHETRYIAELAARNPKLATQLGTQIHATDNYRRVVEVVRSGVLGKITEVQCWVEKTRFGGTPGPGTEVPKTLHWDLWLGPAPERPYNADYHPRGWRSYWTFGSGTLGDMGCHLLDLPFWALDLDVPLSAEAKGPDVHAEFTPTWLEVEYAIARKSDKTPLKLVWFDGLKLKGTRTPLITAGKVPDWPQGILFIGEKGMLVADYNRYKLLPEENFKGYTAPAKSIPASLGHYNEWFEGCKYGKPTLCNFAYGSRLTETAQLGNVAFRTGKKLEWDSATLKARNAPEAANFLQRDYRKGWAL